MAISTIEEGGSLDKFIRKGVEDAFAKEIDHLFEEKKKEIVEEIDKRKAHVLSETLLFINKSVSVDFYRDRITFTLATKEVN